MRTARLPQVLTARFSRGRAKPITVRLPKAPELTVWGLPRAAHPPASPAKTLP
jgi:hypothetical protein